MSRNTFDRFFACEECWKYGTKRRLSECAQHCPPMPPLTVAAIERDVRQTLVELEQPPPMDWPTILGYEPEPLILEEPPEQQMTWPRWTWRKKLKGAQR